MEVEHQIRQFILNSLKWHGSPSSLTSDYPLIKNDILDSMAIFETIAYLEDQFGIEIQDEVLVPENFKSISAIARLVSASQAR